MQIRSEIVQMHNNFVKFYDYQQLLVLATKCHALIPLVHPEQSAYFLTLTKNGGKGKQRVRLSGIIAQLIGNRIPSLVHAKARQTTWARDSFQQAMQDLIDYYSNHSQSESTMT